MHKQNLRRSGHDISPTLVPMPTSDVDAAIAQTLAATNAAVEPVGTGAHDLLEPLTRFATKGKRIRAKLLVASHGAHHGTHHSAVIHVAAAVELFQTAALIHDDVLDSADTRRGEATIHRALEAQHRERAWTGDAAHYGVSGAVLAGDLALMAAHRALAMGGSLVPADQATRTLSLFASMAELCTAGQYLDMRVAAQPVEALEGQYGDVVAVMRSKTASYTAEFPLALGASVAGASDEAVAAMRAVGVPLGIAFQLRDDILGLVGAPDITGKPAGDDVREGKRTLLMVHAWNHADASQRQAIVAAFGNAHAQAHEINAAVEVAVSLGAVEQAEKDIERLVADARAALARAIVDSALDSDALAELDTLVTATTQRVA